MPSYVLQFTPTDAHSTAAGELTYQVRDAASGGGTLLHSDIATAGSPVTTSSITDNGLQDGSNARWLRIIDGAGNIHEAQFNIEFELYQSRTTEASGVGSATAQGEAFGRYVTRMAHASGAGAAQAAGLYAYVWAKTDASGSGLAAGVGLLAFVWSEASAHGVGTASASGLIDADEVVRTARASGVGSARARGVAFPVFSSIPNISPRRRQPRFYLAIYPPVGAPNARNRLDVIDINADITGLNWQSSWPGGFSQLTAGHDHSDGWADRRLAHPLIPRELTTGDYSRVVLSDGPLMLWEGRTGEVDESPALRRTIRARGFGYTALSDNPYMSTSETEDTSARILRSAIASAAPAVRTAFGDLYVDPQVRHTPAEFRFQFPLQILDLIHKEGDHAGNLMDWGVWENRTLVLLPRVAPSRPDYWVPLEDRFVSDWKRIPPERGRVWVKHNVAGEETVTGPVVDPRFSDQVGFQRSVVLNAGEMSENSALRFARTHLRFHSVARYAGEITIGPDDHLTGWGGRPVPGYLARAGQWVKVGDYEPLVIITCEHNPNVPRTRLRLGERIDSYQSRVAATMRDNELRKLGTDPVGGRLR